MSTHELTTTAGQTYAVMAYLGSNNQVLYCGPSASQAAAVLEPGTVYGCGFTRDHAIREAYRARSRAQAKYLPSLVGVH